MFEVVQQGTERMWNGEKLIEVGGCCFLALALSGELRAEKTDGDHGFVNSSHSIFKGQSSHRRLGRGERNALKE
jgi:hypothetical protein